MAKASSSPSAAAIMRRLRRVLARIEANPRRPEEALRKRAEAVLADVAKIPAAILIANNRGRYVDANRAATVLTGYTNSELIRLAVWDLTPPGRQGLGR